VDRSQRERAGILDASGTQVKGKTSGNYCLAEPGFDGAHLT
jgi:hypothetical protein